MVQLFNAKPFIIQLFLARIIITGSSDGTLVSYLLNQKIENGESYFDYKPHQKRNIGRGKKPIQNIIIFGDVGLFFTLCGMQLFHHVEFAHSHLNIKMDTLMCGK